MKVAVRILGVMVVVMLLAAMLLEPVAGQKGVGAPALEPPVVDNPEEEVVSSMTAAPEWTRAAHQWTDAEMAAAIPYPAPAAQGKEEMLVPLADTEQTSAVTAGYKVFPGALAEGDVSYLRDMDGLDALNLGGFSAPAGYGYPAPFTRYTYYGKYKADYPYKTIGVLYFVQYGVAYRCSASSIGNYAIWTAGHCVHAGDGSSDGWSYYVMFLPQYDNGRRQGGSWLAHDWNLWSLNGWIYNGDLRYDMGGVILNNKGRNSISRKVGALGFAYRPDDWGYWAENHWFGIGYPAESPFDGKKQVVCASSYAYSDTNFTTHPQPVGVGCDQTGGTSGGPWVLAYGSGNYLNGNMSYRYNNHPYEIFSPYFGNGAYNLWYALLNDVP